MTVGPEGRWPPIYDADGLAAVIRELAKADDFEARFWFLSFDASEVCQGDVIYLPSAVPLLDERGEPVATDECEHWLAIGNSCDFDRKVEDEPFTQIVPLVDFGPEVERGAQADFRSYRYARRFYVPPWPGGEGHHRLADFMRPAAIHKEAFPETAISVARMQYPAWVLLHSCLVRFLCRDDGRFD